MPERFECTTLAKKGLYKYSFFSFLFLGLERIHSYATKSVTHACMATVTFPASEHHRSLVTKLEWNFNC